MKKLTDDEKKQLTREKLKKYNYIKIKSGTDWTINGGYLFIGKIYKIKRRSFARFFINPDKPIYGKWHEYSSYGYNQSYHFVTDEYAKKHGYKE